MKSALHVRKRRLFYLSAWGFQMKGLVGKIGSVPGADGIESGRISLPSFQGQNRNPTSWSLLKQRHDGKVGITR